MALHGGIEEGTAELAAAAADRSGSSYYSVVIGDGLWWHVPSTKFDPRESAALRQFLDHVEVVISVHGYGRRELGATVLLGGGNRALAEEAAEAIGAHTGLSTIHDLNAMPAGLRGMSPANPVNLAPQKGVQVELPPSARNGSVGSGVVDALVEIAQSAASAS